MDHAVRVQREITAPSPVRASPWKKVGVALVCVPLLAFCVYSWWARPAWIWGAARAVPVVEQDANLRFAMYLLAQRIESYRAAHGALPVSLDALQDSLPGVAYAMLSDSLFELTTSRAGAPIVFRSDDSVDAFLGNATAIVQGYR
jgi:hypothetical protein